jgi:hypothetical protein
MKVFADTSMLFWALLQFAKNWFLRNDNFLIKNFESNTINIYINDFVIAELQRNAKKRFWVDSIIVDQFIYRHWFILCSNSKNSDKDFEQYVFDVNDVAILAWCIQNTCNILRTKNLKDFDIPKILSDFQITVTDELWT